MLPSSDTLGGVRRVLALRSGGYLRASGMLFGWLATFVALMPLLDWAPARRTWGYLAAPCNLTAHHQC